MTSSLLRNYVKPVSLVRWNTHFWLAERVSKPLSRAKHGITVQIWENGKMIIFVWTGLKTSLDRFKLHLDTIASDHVTKCDSKFEEIKFRDFSVLAPKSGLGLVPNQNGDLGRLGLKTYLHDRPHDWPASDYVTVIQIA